MTIENAAGWIAIIAAVGAQITGIVIAIRQHGARAKIDDIHDQVTTSNGETLAEIVEGNDLRDLDPADPPPLSGS